MLLDMRAGRPTEIDVINGAIPPLAAKLGLDAPVNQTVSGLVHAIERSDAPSHSTLPHRAAQTRSGHGETPPSPLEFPRKPRAG